MHFLATADTDIGISRNTNQDSALIRHAITPEGEVLLAVVCDGMGGLAKGEVASATVIRRFQEWFELEFTKESHIPDMKSVGKAWERMLWELNGMLLAYGKQKNIRLGTTVTGILLTHRQYVIIHVGDSRACYLDRKLIQLTEDQTLVAREVRRGRMTPEQARRDSRRNVLLQCVGASEQICPQVLHGTVKKGVYLVGSDGFFHEITGREITKRLHPESLKDKEAMHREVRRLIHLVKARREPDNITAVLVKAE